MNHRVIGDWSVSEIGLGGMPMSIEGRPDEDRSIRTIHAALDAGVTLIDTADAYHRDADEVGHNESLIARPCRRLGSAPRTSSSRPRAGTCAPVTALDPQRPPGAPQEAARASLQRLGVDAIGLYQFHRPDPDVPYAESVGALARPARRGRHRDGRHLQRGPRPDPRGAGGARRPPRVGAEPVLAGLPQSSRASSTCAPSSASPSCRGARSAASRVRAPSRATEPLSRGSALNEE